MRSLRRARIGGLTFAGWPRDHHDDWFVLDQEGIKGVWEGVDVRREDAPLPLAHGSFDASVYLASRVIPISGNMSAQSPAKLVHQIARLTGLLSGGQSDRLYLDDDAGTTWMNVRLGAATQVTQLDATTAQFQLTLWAADPRRYGNTNSFSPGSVYHYGNFRAVADAVVTGPQSAPYTLTVAGRQFTVTQALSAGQVHTIDTASARVRRNGALQSSVFSKAQSLIVAPGVASTFSGPSSAVLKVRDTFV